MTRRLRKLGNHSATQRPGPRTTDPQSAHLGLADSPADAEGGQHRLHAPLGTSLTWSSEYRGKAHPRRPH